MSLVLDVVHKKKYASAHSSKFLPPAHSEEFSWISIITDERRPVGCGYPTRGFQVHGAGDCSGQGFCSVKEGAIWVLNQRPELGMDFYSPKFHSELNVWGETLFQLKIYYRRSKEEYFIPLENKLVCVLLSVENAFFLLNSEIKMTWLLPFAKSIFSLSQPKGTTWYFQVSIKDAFPSAGAESNNRPYGTPVYAKWRRIELGIKYVKVSSR